MTLSRVNPVGGCTEQNIRRRCRERKGDWLYHGDPFFLPFVIEEEVVMLRNGTPVRYGQIEWKISGWHHLLLLPPNVKIRSSVVVGIIIAH